MATQSSPLHLLFFPLLAQGHLLPLADMARLFALRGVKCTFLTTHANVTYVRPTIDNTNKFLESKFDPQFVPISISMIPFPSAEVGLPHGSENISSSTSPDMQSKFFQAFFMLETPFEQALKEINPDAFVSDTFYPWSADVSARTGIPRLVFNGMGLLACCAQLVVLQIIESLPEDIGMFVVPGLPYRLEMHRTQFFDPTKNKEMLQFFKLCTQKDARSYGEIVNSFLELEADFAVHWRDVVGRKAWLIGPISLSNEKLIEIPSKGGEGGWIGTEELLQWLDSKCPGSVVYICFGSMASMKIPNKQLREIAVALEGLGRDFIWAVNSSTQEGSDDWLKSFEERMVKEKKGFIIRGWAPQIFILNHSAVGGFLTHCGWNSTLESVSAGVPMITWPMNGDQFFNEKLIVEVLRVGASVGAKEGGMYVEKQQLIQAGTIKSAIESVIGEGVEGEAMQERAKGLKEKARAAVQDGGSSYTDLGNLIEELVAKRKIVSI